MSMPRHPGLWTEHSLGTCLSIMSYVRPWALCWEGQWTPHVLASTGTTSFSLTLSWWFSVPRPRVGAYLQ